MLAYGTTWVNAMDCRFEDNQVGFRFNAEGTVVTHTDPWKDSAAPQTPDADRPR